MRIIAVLLNLLLLGFFISWFIEDGVPEEPVVFCFMLVGLLSPIINLIVIFSNSGNNYISLFLKRKALEEKMKIEQISQKQK
jgi:hypothetical protein